MPISQITTVKNRHEDVIKHLPRWLKSDVDEIILVDFGCSDDSTKHIVNSKHFNDRRVKLVKVAKELSGPFYNHGLARNIGVRGAMFDTFLFVNADSYYPFALIDYIKSFEEEEVVYPLFLPDGIQEYLKPSYLMENLPDNRHIHDQFAVNSATFYNVNGFVEDNAGWGAISYDFINRALEVNPKVKYFPYEIVHTDHTQATRNMNLPITVNNRNKKKIFTDSYKILYLTRQRTPRAQPGKLFGIANPDDGVVIINSKTNYGVLIPGGI